MSPAATETSTAVRIPIRNLWLLMLYASELTRFKDQFNALIEQDTEDLPGLVTQLLAAAVERRMKRNLTRGYVVREGAVRRVRGRIDLLRTEAQQLLARGEIYCHFEEFTIDTPRNRYVRAALTLSAGLVRSPELAQRCRTLSLGLGQAGVSGILPSRASLASDQIGRNDANDRLMLTLAALIFDLGLPTEEAGNKTFLSADRGGTWVRELFEKAVLGFCRVELEPLGWKVTGHQHLRWAIADASPGIAAILPQMITDMVLRRPDGSLLVIDTKFAAILTSARFREVLKSGYLYQIYAYLRSQENIDLNWSTASGLLLHPATGANVREHVIIQNHAIAFATVDLSASTQNIRSELRQILTA